MIALTKFFTKFTFSCNVICNYTRASTRPLCPADDDYNTVQVLLLYRRGPNRRGCPVFILCKVIGKLFFGRQEIRYENQLVYRF